MRFASYIISICLHAAVFLLIWWWPAPPALKLNTPPMMISLVEGDQGGNRTPSPILGHMGEPAQEEMAPQPPAPQSEVASREKPEAILPRPEPAQAPAETMPVKPAPRQEPMPIPVKQPEAPKPEPVKPEPKKEVPKPEPKPEPKKETPKPEPKKGEEPKPEKKDKPAPKKTVKPDPVAEALAKARKASSRNQSQERGSAVERALAQARRNAGGNRGGGGGSGDGPGGGGLGDVYMGEIMLAVRPNWGFASSTRLSLVCVVKVNIDMQGKVLNAVISRSSGNAQYDASAVNAVIRTSNNGDFPAPPNPGYTELDLVFTLDELRSR